MANYVSKLTVPNGDTTATYDIREIYPHVGTCSTGASSSAKVVTIGNFKLYTGAWVVVKFASTNTAAVSSLTLNVDGTGAKSIKYRNANLSEPGQLIAGRYTMFIYDGTSYQIVGDFDSDTDLDTKVDQVLSSVNEYHPLLLAESQKSVTTATVTGTSLRNNSIYANPSTGSIYVSNVYGAGAESQSTAPTGGYHVYDCRSATVTPAIGDKAANFYFHMSDSPDTGKWWSIFHIRGWGGEYSAWELAGPSHNVDQRTTPLYVRTSNKHTAWGSWRKIYDVSNPPSRTELGFGTIVTHSEDDYVLKTGDTMSGNLTFAVSDSSDTPAIVFKRGNFTDSSLDWKIYNSSGALMMDRTVAGDSETWQNKFKIDGTGAWYGGSRLALVSEIVDSKVTQSPSATEDFRPLVLGATRNTDPEQLEPATGPTDKVYVSKRVFVQPSTGNLTLYSTSGDSPSLMFRRGTLVDNLNDWKIYVSGGGLYFAQSTANASSETWTNKMYFHPSDGNLYVGGTKVSLSGHTHTFTVPSSFAVKTGSSTQARITLQTLMTWLITTKKYIPAGAHRKLSLHTTWAYADNDILQFTVDGINYEMTLAGVVIEFDGYASDYQTGVFRLRIHSAPVTNSFVLTDGYERFPLSHIAEYYCNGSDYTPIWKMLINRSDIANGTSTTGNGTISVVGKPVSVYGLGTAAYTESTDYVPTSMLTVTKNTTVGITPSSNAFGYVSGLTRAAWNFQQTDGTLLSQYYNEKWQNEIYMDYRTGQMSTRGKNNGTWQDWRIQLDSGNFSSYAVPNTKSGVISAINLLDEATANITSDNAHFISEENNGSTTNYYRRKFSGLWGYINGKISATNTGTGNAVTSISYSNGVITATKGSTFLTTHQTVTDGNPTLEWGTQSTVATIGSTDIHVTMPDNPNTDTKVNVTLATTTKAYLLGTSTTPTSSAQAVTSVADTGVYLGTTAGMLCVNGTICANAGNNTAAGGLSLYGTDPETYGVMFRQTQYSGKHGYVQSDWATYFTMNAGATTRGWIFRKKTDGCVASISGVGNAVFNGSVTVGGNTTNTSGCRMNYNTTTQSLDFVFV